MHALRLGAVFAVAILARASAIGQVGGFGGGGFGGGAAGLGSETGAEVTQQLILTPGDKGEWLVDAQAGETIVASAKSTVFDPAIEVVDSQGKVLASNDDEGPGIQNPRLAYRFATAGKYRVWVKGYKSAAGGPFELTLRRFVSTLVDAPTPKPVVLDEKGTQWLRVVGKKGRPFSVWLSSPSDAPGYELLGPNGKVLSEEEYPSIRSRIDLREVEDGEYYVKVHARHMAKEVVEASTRNITAYPVELGKPIISRTLAADTIELAQLSVKEGDFFRIEISGSNPKTWFAVETMESEGPPKEVAQVFDNRTKRRWAVYLAKEKADVVVAVRQSGDTSAEYSLSILDTTMKVSGGQVGRSLGLGQIDYYQVDGKSGDILRLQAESKAFDVQLRLLNSKGVRIDEADDIPGSTNSVFTTVLPENGPYYLAVSSYGMGGSGEYRLTQEKVAPTQLLAGKPGAKSITPTDSHVWSINGKKGQRIVLSLNSSINRIDLTVAGPRGQGLRTAEQSRALIVSFPEDGEYTVWVRAEGSGEYRIQLIDLDK